MSQRAIEVEKLSKRYRIGASRPKRNGRRNPLHYVSAPFSYLASTLREPTPEETLWALRDVSFEVKRGEVLGIIGRNGSGKSTLLRVLSRITEPTRGRALIRGRVGSLLEVGTGFHPELTGRENTYLNGAILGMKRAEIDRKYDEIVAFAEVGRFMDTQVKRYSSGMYVRLAFAVAAHLETEILLVDEVLAVGDSAFQRRCLARMGDVAGQGRTVLFVSHNMLALQSLCARAVWLSEGGLLADGPSSQVISQYVSSTPEARTEQVWTDSASAPGNDEVRLSRISAHPQGGAPGDIIDLHTPIEVEIEYWNLVPDARLHATLYVQTDQQVVAFSTGSLVSDQAWATKPHPVGLFRSVCTIPPDLLNSGYHSLSFLVVRNTDTVTFRLDNAVSFEVLDLDERQGGWFGREPGVVQPVLNWNTVFLGNGS